MNKPDFEKAAKEAWKKEFNSLDELIWIGEMNEFVKHYVAGCEYAYSILNQKCEEEKNEIANNSNMYIKKLEKKIAELKDAYSIDKETIEKQIDKVELMEMIHKVHEDMEGRYDLTGEDLYTIQALLCKLQ